jgi:hypothetical protein
LRIAGFAGVVFGLVTLAATGRRSDTGDPDAVVPAAATEQEFTLVEGSDQLKFSR